MTNPSPTVKPRQSLWDSCKNPQNYLDAMLCGSSTTPAAKGDSRNAELARALQVVHLFSYEPECRVWWEFRPVGTELG